MKYLNENIILTISNVTISANGLYEYHIQQYKNSAWTDIFVGNTYLYSSTSTVNINCTDIIANTKWDGDVSEFSSTTSVNLISKFRIGIKVNNTMVYGTAQLVALVYQYPNLKSSMNCEFFDYDSSTSSYRHLLQGETSTTSTPLIPHLPYNFSTKYQYPITMEVGSAGSYSVSLNGNLSYENSHTITLFKPTSVRPLSMYDIFNDATYSEASVVEHYDDDITYNGMSYFDRRNSEFWSETSFVDEATTTGYLTFTANSSSGISMSNYGGNIPAIEYKLNDGDWEDWDDFSNISLTSGDVIKFRGLNSEGFSSSSSVYSQFVMTGSLAASGSVMSLIDKFGTSTVIPNEYCFKRLFFNCTALTSAPALPATTLKNGCYYEMFYNCTALTSAPFLPAEEAAANCYFCMFYNCSNLRYIKCLTDTSAYIACTDGWCVGVSSSGVFVKSSSATSWGRNESGIPSGWTVSNYQLPNKYAKFQFIGTDGTSAQILFTTSTISATGVMNVDVSIDGNSEYNYLRVDMKYSKNGTDWLNGGYVSFTGGVASTQGKEVRVKFTATMNTTPNSGEPSLKLSGFSFLTTENTVKSTYLKVGNTTIAEVDICPKKYYVLWQDRMGGFQSQPFEKTETFSENITRKEYKTYYGERRTANLDVQPKWSVNSGWISEKLYPYYESIFISNYIILYDVEEDNIYRVLVKDADYTEKTFKNQNRKLFNLNLSLELDKPQNIIY